MSDAGALVVECCQVIEACGYALRFGDGVGGRLATRGVSWSDPIRRVVWLRPTARNASHEMVAHLYAHETAHVVQQSGGVKRGSSARRYWWGVRYAVDAVGFRWRVECEAEGVEAWARWIVGGRRPTSDGGIRALISATTLWGDRAPYFTGRTQAETIDAIAAVAHRYIDGGLRPWEV